MKFSTTSQYRKDIKRIQKQGLDLSLLNIVLEILLAGKPLPPQYKDHALMGNYIGLRECHIRPDWLLVYSVNNDKLVLTATRTGSHAELF